MNITRKIAIVLTSVMGIIALYYGEPVIALLNFIIAIGNWSID